MLVAIVLAALTAEAAPPPRPTQEHRLRCRSLSIGLLRRNPNSRGRLPECFAPPAASLRQR